MHACGPSLLEAKAEGSLMSLKPDWDTVRPCAKPKQDWGEGTVSRSA